MAWSAVGTGGPSSTVEQLLEFDDGTGAKLYAGGAFAYGLKCWDGATWTIVGGGLGSGYSTHVYDLEVFHVDGAPALFVAGDFTQAGGQPGFNAIAAWTGTEWLSLGGGMSPPCYPPWVRQLVLFDEGAGPQLFVSGCFSAVGGLPIQYQALWTGTAWTALSNPVEGDLYTTITWDAGGGPVEYVGGEFTQIGPVVGSNLMRYSATGGWDPFDANNGLSGYSPNGDHYTAALALATFNTGSGESLYVAGDFAKAGNTNANCIARWNGSSWAALGTGLNAPAYALATHDAGSGLGLYVGGRFTTAGGVSASRVARWSGTSWAAVGAGLPGDVYALASHNDGSGSKLYAGGAFAGVQRWNGSAWSAVGSGLTDEVYALESGNVGQTALFAATAMNVWKWNGANWTAIGVQQNTYALEICDLGAGPRLYAGGQEYSGGPSHLASWDGTNWTPLQPPIDDTEYGGAVTALRVYDDGTGPKLFVGGYFLGAGGIYSTCLLRWDGALWTAMPGGGANNQVAALAPFADVNGPALYVGGFFSVAGGSAAAGLARYGCQPPVPGDLDGDYDVDFDDAQLFWGCLGGPGVGVGSACEPGDLDADADIDLRDYAQLQAVSGTRSGSAGRRRRCVPLRAARHAPE